MTICTPWRAANSLNKLQAQLDGAYPTRSKASDGSIGDSAHQAEGACGSQHNSCCIKYLSIWIIRARDYTHDPARGADMGRISEQLRLSRDPRIRYIIFNRRITGPNYGWEWHAYSGTSPHTEHMHVSVWDDAARFDNTADWRISAPAAMATQEEGVLFVQIRNGDTNGGGIYAVAPGAAYHVTEVDWKAFPAKPGLLVVPWSFVAGMVATNVRVPDDVLSAAEIAAFAEAVASKVVTNPDTPAQQGDAQALAAAVADELADRLRKQATA